MTQSELASAGFEVDGPTHTRLSRFVDLLLEANQRINLTALRAPQDVWGVHVCDSLAVLPLIRQSQSRSMLDLGSGGGLPGVPLACALPEQTVALLDATGKKLNAVREICAGLGLHNVTFHWGRAESLAHDRALREQFDLVTARAVGALPTLLELAAGFIRQHGYGLFYKSCQAAAEEIEQARSAAHTCSLVLEGTHRYRLPAAHGERALVAYRKGAHLRRDLPRTGQLIARGPL